MTRAANIRPTSVSQFLAWAQAQDEGRFELIDGEIVAMAPERARHVRTKLAVAIALRDGVRRAGLPCEVFGDGMTIRINENTARGPDAVVQCGRSTDPDSLLVDAPLIVVEVLSPSSERSDTGGKFAEYFSLASVRHYLVVDPRRGIVIHHARAESGEIGSQILSDGELHLDPPGIAVPVRDILGEAQ